MNNNIKMTKEQKFKLRKVFDERFKQRSDINSYITKEKSMELIKNLSIDDYKLTKTSDNTLEFIKNLKEKLVILNITCTKGLKLESICVINVMSIVKEILNKYIMIDNKVNIENIYKVDIVKEVDTFYELNKDDYEYRGLVKIYNEYKQYTYIRTLGLLLIYISELFEIEREKED